MEDNGIFAKKGKFIIFKHSPICNLSETAKIAVNKYLNTKKHLEVIEINVISESDLKMEITEKYKIKHESPQILLINNQKCVDNFDHMEITLGRLNNLK